MFPECSSREMPLFLTRLGFLLLLFDPYPLNAQLFDQTDYSTTSVGSWYGDNWYQLGTGFSGTLQALTIKCYTTGSSGSVGLEEFADSGYSVQTNAWGLSTGPSTSCFPTLADVTFTGLNIPLYPTRYYRLSTLDTLQNRSVILLGTSTHGNAMYDTFVYGQGGVQNFYTFYPYMIPAVSPPPICPQSRTTLGGSASFPVKLLFGADVTISSLGLQTTPSGGLYCCSQSYISLQSDANGVPGSTLATSAIITLSQYDSSAERYYAFTPPVQVRAGTAFWISFNVGPSSTTNRTAVGNFVDFQAGCGTNLGAPGPTNPAGFSKEPINTATGNYLLSQTDLTVPGKGESFSFTRTYNSADGYAGPLGSGWTHSFNIFVSVTAGTGIATVKEPDGHQDSFSPSSGGSYISGTPGLVDGFAQSVDGTFVLTRKNQTRLFFSSLGKLTSIVDQNGNPQTLAYDGSGNLTSIIDSSGRTFTFAADGHGRMTSMTDPIGRTWQYSYDGNGNLVLVRDAAGGVTQYTYDANHHMISAVDARGVTFLRNTFDGQGRVVTQTNARSFTTMLAYSTPVAGATTITDPLGNTTQHAYDGALRLIQVIDARGGTASCTYDSNNNRTSTTNQNGNTMTFAYDGQANLTGIIDPLGNTAGFTYDAKNNLVTAINAKGATTVFSYDVNGNLTSVRDALGNATLFSYGPSGLLASKTDARGNSRTYGYDSQGDLTKRTDSLGKATVFAYDSVGRLLAATDANGHTSSLAYNVFDRTTKATDALGNLTAYSYDPVGNLLKITDANGNATSYSYDPTNNLASVMDAGSGLTAYGYDANNNRTTVTNAKENATTFVYDALNHLVRITDPLSFSTSYAYDLLGNVVSTTDANGKTNQYTYDPLNRLVAGTFADGSSVGYAYDKNGNRTSMTDSRGLTSYSYDGLDRVLSVISPGGSEVQYGYDASGNRAMLTYPDGRVVHNQYDPLNRLSIVTDWAAKATAYSYDAVGNLTGYAYPNGASSSYSYDPANRLLQIVNRSGSQVLSSFGYALDAVGNRLQVTSNAGGTTKYGYDSLYRLTSWIAPSGQTTQYTYDPVGNRLSMVSSAGTTSYSYDKADRLLSAGATSYSYDQNGNQKTKTTGPTVISYVYDALNRLASASGGGIASQYNYDGDGNRVSQIVPAGSYRYVNDTASPLPAVLNENGPDGNIDYLYGRSMISETSVAFQYFYQSDGLGSAASLTDPSGALKATYAYDPWGKLTTPIDPLGTKNKFKFAGEALDANTGSYFMRARYYDPNSARFTSRDPLLISRLIYPHSSVYQYAYDNPLSFRDPTGLIAEPSQSNGSDSVLTLSLLGLQHNTTLNAQFNVAPAYTAPLCEPVECLSLDLDLLGVIPAGDNFGQLLSVLSFGSNLAGGNQSAKQLGIATGLLIAGLAGSETATIASIVGLALDLPQILAFEAASPITPTTPSVVTPLGVVPAGLR